MSIILSDRTINAMDLSEEFAVEQKKQELMKEFLGYKIMVIVERDMDSDRIEVLDLTYPPIPPLATGYITPTTTNPVYPWGLPQGPISSSTSATFGSPGSFVPAPGGPYTFETTGSIDRAFAAK